MAYPKDYLNNVFINCPFDNQYKPIFDSLVFAIHDCGYIARCAKEVDDSGGVRDFLVTNSRRTSIAGSRYIFGRYNQFRTDLPTICASLHKDITEITFIEFSDVVTGWISMNSTS